MAVKRPPSYYFADELDEKKEAMLQAVAIDGDTVKELAKLPWPGCALPWKVTKISPAGLQKAVLVGHPTEVVAVTEEASKRRRKGKKTRIALRKKIEAAKAKQEEREKLAKAKEESEQAKRTRRNREKKLKKKAKEKAKKLAGPAGGDAAQQELEDVSDSASE
jgi:predicted ribosome quality control (RQC) complex YloA/Tae2 family protein